MWAYTRQLETPQHQTYASPHGRDTIRFENNFVENKVTHSTMSPPLSGKVNSHQNKECSIFMLCISTTFHDLHLHLGKTSTTYSDT